ncbi:MAG: tetratricopeptide repeat protein [bacterium]
MTKTITRILFLCLFLICLGYLYLRQGAQRRPWRESIFEKARLPLAPVYLVPVGSIDKEIVSDLKTCFEKSFGSPAVIVKRMSLPAYAYDREKKQYSPAAIVYALKKKYGGYTNHIIGVTDVDLKDEAGKWKYVWSWIFYGDSGVVSLSRLRPRSMSYRYTRAVGRAISKVNRIIKNFPIEKPRRENLISEIERYLYSKKIKNAAIKKMRVINKLMELAGIKKTDDEILKHRLEMVFLKKAAESFGLGGSKGRRSFLRDGLTHPRMLDKVRFKWSKDEKLYLAIHKKYEEWFIYGEPFYFLQEFKDVSSCARRSPVFLTLAGIANVYEYLLNGQDEQKLRDAKELLEKALKSSRSNQWALSWLARIAYLQGNSTESEKYRDSVNRVNRRYRYAHQQFGWLLLRLGEYRKAAVEFEQGFILGTDYPNFHDIPEKKKTNYLKKIVPEIEKMQAVIPNEEKYLYTIYFAGTTYYRAGEYEKALKTFEEMAASKNAPRFAFLSDVYNMQAYILTDKLEKDFERALELADKAIELGEGQAGEGYYRDTRGWTLYKMGRYREALKEMERAVELVPDNYTKTHEHLGAVTVKIKELKNK